VVVGRALGSEFGGVTVDPGPDFSGKARGPSSSREASIGDNASERDYCAVASQWMPPIGESRRDASEVIVIAHARVIELVAGYAAELLMYPDEPPFLAERDRHVARKFTTSVICRSESAVDAFIDYAGREALALIERYRHVVLALVETLLIRRTLDAVEIDATIAAALASEDARAERQRRAEWRQTVLRAGEFHCEEVSQWLER
jgi:hypothetical protein